MINNNKIPEAGVTVPLFGRAVASVWQVMALSPDRPFFQRELSRLTGQPYNGVVQALRTLVRDDLVTRAILGGKPAFRANDTSAYFPEFQRIALRSLRIPEALEEAGIVALKVAIFGSFAKSVAGPESDLDVFVVGSEPALGRATAALGQISRRLGRAVNVVVYDHARYQREREEDGTFMAAIVDAPLVNLLGTL